MAGHGSISVTLDDKAEEFLSLLRSLHERLDDQERQIK